MPDKVRRVARSVSQYDTVLVDGKSVKDSSVNPKVFKKPPRTGFFSVNKLHLVESIQPDQPPESEIGGTHTKGLSFEDERLPCSFFLFNLVFFVWGIVGVSVTMVLHLIESESQGVLNFESQKTKVLIPTIFMYCSGGLTILASTGGSIAFVLNFKHFLPIYRHILWYVLAMDIFAAIFAYASWHHVNMLQFERLLEAKAVHLRSNDSTYIKLWPDRYEDFWDMMQSQFHCCGYSNVSDWTSLCGCIPKSCCREGVKTECEKMLDVFNADKNESAVFNESMIYFTYGCQQVAVLEQKSLQRDWIIFPLLIALFDFIFMIHGTELMTELTEMLSTSHGQRIVRHYRRTIWICRVIRAVCQRRKTIATQTELRRGERGSFGESGSDSDDDTKIKRSLFHGIRRISRRITTALPLVPSLPGERTVFVTSRASVAQFLQSAPVDLAVAGAFKEIPPPTSGKDDGKAKNVGQLAPVIPALVTPAPIVVEEAQVQVQAPLEEEQHPHKHKHIHIHRRRLSVENEDYLRRISDTKEAADQNSPTGPPPDVDIKPKRKSVETEEVGPIDARPTAGMTYIQVLDADKRRQSSDPDNIQAKGPDKPS